MAFNFGNLFPGYRVQQQEAANIEQTKASTEALLEQTQGQKLDNQNKQVQLDFQKRLAQLMSTQKTGVDGDKPRDVAAEIDTEADLYRAAGFPNDAAALNERASLIRSHNATAMRAQIGMQKEQTDMVRQRTMDLSRIADQITDQETWDAATKGTEFEGTDYNPRLVKALRQAGETVHEQNQDTSARLNRADRRLKELADQEHQHKLEKHWTAIEDIQRRNSETRAGKDHAKSAAAPNKAELAAAGAALQKAYPGLQGSAEKWGESPESKGAMEAIASEAKQLVAANPAIRFEEAVNQAMYNHRADFKVIGKRGLFGKEKTTFTGGGNSPEQALPLAKDVAAAIAGTSHDKSALQDALDSVIPGKFYESGGKMYQAVEGGFIRVDPDTGEELEEDAE